MNDLRTPLARARGLGSAKEGVHHWWVQRLTAIALVPLSVWFVCSLMHMLMTDDPDAVFEAFINPFVAIGMLAFILIGLLHVKLGLQVIIEDYVHKKSVQLTLLLLNSFGCLALAAVALFSIIQLHYFYGM